MAIFRHGCAALIAIASAVGASASPWAQENLPAGEKADQHYVNATRTVLRDVTDATRPTLLKSEGATASRISYRVTALRNISVISEIHRGQRVVVLTLGAATTPVNRVRSASSLVVSSRVFSRLLLGSPTTSSIRFLRFGGKVANFTTESTK